MNLGKSDQTVFGSSSTFLRASFSAAFNASTISFMNALQFIWGE
jgi:hypothetical protein